MSELAELTKDQEQECHDLCEEIWKNINSWDLTHEQFLGLVNPMTEYDPGEEVYRSPEGSVLTSSMVTMWIQKHSAFSWGFREAFKLLRVNQRS